MTIDLDGLVPILVVRTNQTAVIPELGSRFLQDKNMFMNVGIAACCAAVW